MAEITIQMVFGSPTVLNTKKPLEIETLNVLDLRRLFFNTFDIVTPPSGSQLCKTRILHIIFHYTIHDFFRLEQV